MTKTKLERQLRFNGLVSDDHEKIIGSSLALQKCLREVRRRAIAIKNRKGEPQGNNILLFGETGTGKELIAEYAHDKSPRAHEKMEKVLNLVALSIVKAHEASLVVDLPSPLAAEPEAHRSRLASQEAALEAQHVLAPDKAKPRIKRKLADVKKRARQLGPTAL